MFTRNSYPADVSAIQGGPERMQHYDPISKKSGTSECIIA